MINNEHDESETRFERVAPGTRGGMTIALAALCYALGTVALALSTLSLTFAGGC